MTMGKTGQKRSNSQKRATRKRRSKKNNPPRFKGLLPSLASLMVLGLVLAVIYLIPMPVREEISSSAPVYEEFPSAPAEPSATRPKPQRHTPVPTTPRVAIIIDDIGFHPTIDLAFAELDPHVSFAILPYAPHATSAAIRFNRSGHDILIHFPMEPFNGALDPGPGVLTISMGLNEMIKAIDKAVNKVPYAIGVNNHMGSKFTSDPKAMELFLGVISSKGFFFIDSRTTAETVAYETAQAMGIPSNQRSIFLDPKPDKKIIHRQLQHLISIAEKNGQAIAIGHPYPETLEVLRRELPLLKKQVTIVPVHKILH